MLKSLGTMRNVPRPSPQVIQEAISLLSVMGGSGDAKKMLNDMKSVQEHNEQVAASARLVIEEANERDREVTEGEAILHQKVRMTEADLAQKRSKLADDESSVRERLKGEEEQLQRREGELVVVKEEIAVQRTADTEMLLRGKDALQAKENDLVRREEELRLARGVLNVQEEEYKQERLKFADQQRGLHTLKDKLDARDARVLEAMNMKEHDDQR